MESLVSTLPTVNGPSDGKVLACPTVWWRRGEAQGPSAPAVCRHPALHGCYQHLPASSTRFDPFILPGYTALTLRHTICGCAARSTHPSTCKNLLAAIRRHLHEVEKFVFARGSTHCRDLCIHGISSDTEIREWRGCRGGHAPRTRVGQGGPRK